MPNQGSGPPLATANLPFASNPAQSPVIAATYDAPVNAAQPDRSRLSTSYAQNKDPGFGPSRGLVQVSAGENLLPLDRQVTTSHFDDPAYSPGSSGNSPPNDQLKYVLERLRQLGTTYFVLEPCGDEKREFRFFCQMFDRWKSAGYQTVLELQWRSSKGHNGRLGPG